MRYLFLFVLISFHSFGEDTIPELDTDTTKHSVRKAVVFSACLPGAGQVYNHIAMPKGKKKAYWKVPLIYAGLGATGYFLISNQQTQKDLKQEYLNRQETGYISPDEYSSYDDQGILTLYDQYLNWRDLSILGLAGVYLLQMVDAGVEAHFVSFDISEDLSLNVEPVLLGNFTGGLSIKLKIR